MFFRHKSFRRRRQGDNDISQRGRKLQLSPESLILKNELEKSNHESLTAHT